MVRWVMSPFWILSIVIFPTDCEVLNLGIYPSGQIREGDAFNLTCNVSGATVDIEVNFTQRWQGDIIQKTKREIDGNTAVYVVQGVEVEDMGEYTCDTKTNTSNTISLSLAASPRVRSLTGVQYVKPHHYVTLSATFFNVSSVQPPGVQWSREGSRNQSLVPIPYNIRGNDINITGVTVSLTWLMTSSDYQQHGVTVCTRGECSYAMFELKQYVSPMSPYDLKVVQNLTNGVWLSWKSEIRVGFKVKFLVSFKPSTSEDDWSIKEVPGTMGNLIYYYLKDLLPGRQYDVRVAAADVQDLNFRSNFTQPIHVLVPPEIHVQCTGVGAGIGIGVGIMLAVGILVVLLLVLFIRHRRARVSERRKRCLNGNVKREPKEDQEQMRKINHYQRTPTQRDHPVVPAIPTPDVPPPPTSPVPPKRPVLPDPPPLGTRQALPRPPVPGRHDSVSSIPTRSSSKKPSQSKNHSKEKKGATQIHPPIPVPLTEEVYEPMGSEDMEQNYEAFEVEDDDEDDEEYVNEEYVAPVMTYQNMA